MANKEIEMLEAPLVYTQKQYVVRVRVKTKEFEFGVVDEYWKTPEKRRMRISTPHNWNIDADAVSHDPKEQRRVLNQVKKAIRKTLSGNDQVVIELDGGLVSNCHATTKHLDMMVFDHDICESDDRERYLEEEAPDIVEIGDVTDVVGLKEVIQGLKDIYKS